MRIKRIDEALELCEGHLSPENSIDGEIQNLLVQSLLILICAEFERKFRELIVKRCSSVSDTSIMSYLETSTRKIFRSLRLSDISGLLTQFGPAHRNKLDQLRDEKAANMYSSIVNNRNSVAHGGVSSATFREVQRYYEEGHVVLDYFHKALWARMPPE